VQPSKACHIAQNRRVAYKIGAGEALRLKIFNRFFLVKTTVYGSKLNFVLDALLDVSLDTRPPLNSARVPFRTRFRPYGNPSSIGGRACISNTALPPNTLAPTTSRDRTRSQSISSLATSFEFCIGVDPLFFVRRRSHRLSRGDAERRKFAGKLTHDSPTRAPCPFGIGVGLDGVRFALDSAPCSQLSNRRTGTWKRKGLKISGDGLNSQDNRGNIGAVDPAENYADRAGLETPDGRSRRKKIQEICLAFVALLFASLAIALAVGLGQRCTPSSEEITIGHMLIAGCRQ
jgi:hypothetical protein